MAEQEEKKADTAQPLLAKRYIVAIMVSLGFAMMNTIRADLNVAIGAMVNNHTIVVNGQEIFKPAEFNWDSRLQGIILGSIYWGYICLQVPGSWLALRFGGTRTFGLGVFIASFLTIFTAPAARLSPYALIALRIGEGLGSGLLMTSNYAIWSKWAPEYERTTLNSLSTAGITLGTIISMPISGILCKYGFDGGWASVFYTFGASGILWYIVWVSIIYESPAVHTSISAEERAYIEATAGSRKTKSEDEIPWGSIFKSVPVYAIIIANITSDWGSYMTLTCLPLFFLDILHFDIQTMGFLAALPFLIKTIINPLTGVLSDVLRRDYMSTKNVRRLMYLTGTLTAGVFLVLASYAESRGMAVACMCVGVGVTGLLSPGYGTNMLDIAPRFSPVTMGISNSCGTVSGFLSPILVGIITEHKRKEEWQTVFWLTLVIYAVGGLLYAKLLSDQRQEWDYGPNEERRSVIDPPDA